MIRVKRGITAHKRKKGKGFQSSSKNRFRLANQKNLKVKISSYRSRKKRKIFFRELWINRINSATKFSGFNFSKFINFCKKSQIHLNRKILAQLIIYESKLFFDIFEIHSV